jgi:hypothetical protein
MATGLDVLNKLRSMGTNISAGLGNVINTSLGKLGTSREEVAARLGYALPRIGQRIGRSTIQTLSPKTQSNLNTLQKKGFGGVQKQGMNALFYTPTDSKGYASQYSKQASANVKTIAATIGTRVARAGARDIGILKRTIFNKGQIPLNQASPTATQPVPPNDGSAPFRPASPTATQPVPPNDGTMRFRPAK